MRSEYFARAALLLALLSFALLAFGCGGERGGGTGAYTVTDAEGTEVVLPKRPHRILTLSMGTDEIMLGLVAPSDMAAVNALLDDPASSNITELAGAIDVKVKDPSLEEILAMRPDLIIVPDWGDTSLVPSLRDAGIPVVVCKGAKSLSDIKETIRLLAAAAGVPARGDALIEKMDVRLRSIEEKVAQIPEADRKSVVLLSLMQTYGGSGSSFDEACRLAGVINGRAAIGIADGQVMTKEDLLRINPDILFLPTYTDHGRYDVDAFRRQYLDDPALRTLQAIRTNAFKEPFEGYLYNNSQDFVFAVQEIAYCVYGADFALGRNEHLSAVEK